jgi:chromosome segregation protein
MLLKSIEISGFKSFAKKSVLEFNRPISAIVGPNGSGKSNAAEAFRFVLGEQSIKSLRGKKGEDLIFNGAGDSARANRASVKVVFDNRQKFFNVDYEEVTIERVVHRDGINEYFVNGSQVRLRDVIELLAGAHIGASGHHIISQGEADRILNSNMKERRAMLEDALGLKIYQYKRVESEKKLEKTLENYQSVDALRKEIAPHLRFLKKQVEKVEKAVELKDELKKLAQEYLKRESHFIAETKKEIELKKTPLLEQKKKLEEELAHAKNVLEFSKNKDAKSDEIIRLEKKIQDARSRKDTLLQDIGRIHGEIASEERILKKQKDIVSSNEGKTL